MRSRDFCYWLQGYFEIHGNRPVREPEETYALNESQIEMIKNHLAMVFKHEIDPSMGDAAHQAALTVAHQGGTRPSPLPTSGSILRDTKGCPHETKFNC